MKNIIIFGTGQSSKIVLNALNKNNVNIVAFADNNFNKHGTIFEGVQVKNPKELINMEFDYIIIAIIKFLPVQKQLLEIGISEGKIVPYFNIDIMDNEKLEHLLDWNKVIRDNYKIKFKQLTIKMQNLPYEIIDAPQRYVPQVKNIVETMETLINSNVSISRFGDGEVKLMAGQDIGFQKAGPLLAERLKEVLISSLDKHIVGILNVFGNLDEYTEDLQNYFREYLYDYREFQYSLFNREKTYYDAFITRPYISYKDRHHAKAIFENFKKIWCGSNVVIVEGDRTRLGRGNDLLDNVKSCERIICPNENAFEVYDRILNSIRKQNKDKLILLALGPTATILAYDLAKEGYWAVDIGHIDIEYEWCLMEAKEKVVVKNKYTNEAYGGNSKADLVDEEYEAQIIDRIG